MLRRVQPLRAAIPTALCTSKPIFEVLSKGLGGASETDMTNPLEAPMTAMLHRYGIPLLGYWKHVTPQVRAKILETEGDLGAKAVKILDQALAGADSSSDETVPILICFGSQTGTAEGIARMSSLYAQAHGLTPTCVSMNDAAAMLKDGQGKNFAAVLFAVSTYGTGEFPTNSLGFYKDLCSGALSASLKDKPFAVFGLGNSMNAEYFNAAAKSLTSKLTEAGATSLTKSVYSCELAPEGHDALFRTFKTAVFASMGAKMDKMTVPDTYNVSTCIGVKAENLQDKGVRYNFLKAPVSYNELVSAKNYNDVEMRHMIINVPINDQIKILGRKLRATDQLVVHPHNKRNTVDRALKVFQVSGDEIVEITPRPGAASSFFDGKKISTRTLFREILDLSAIPARSTLQMLASAAEDPAERADLDLLANDLTASSKYAQLTASGKIFTVLDLLEQYKSIKLSLATALSRLPHIAPRYYSNAHDPETCLSDKFEIVYNTPVKRDGEKVHHGLCTHNMMSATPGASSLWVSLEEGKSTFPNPANDCLMIALGSGIGLLRAAIEARATAQNKNGVKLGKCIVIYGHRTSKGDRLFEKELDAARDSGIISEIRYIASHETPGQFVSPFDEINGDLCSWINKAKAEILYVGLGGSAPHLLAQRFRQQGVNVSAMRKEGTYHEEYFSQDHDSENLMRSSATNPNASLAEKFADADMFCMQCEQTKGGVGCSKIGVCGKTPQVAALQDLTVHYAKVLGFYATELRKLGVAENKEINHMTLFSLFTTLTNVNFDEVRFQTLLSDMQKLVVSAKATYEAAAKKAGREPAALPRGTLPVPDKFNNDLSHLVDEGRSVGVLTRFVDSKEQDAAGVCELLTYGIKGIAAYADHALQNGVENKDIYEYLQRALSFLLSDDRHDLNKALGMCLEGGKVNVTTMSQLYDSHKTLGVPAPKQVPIKPKAGKCILVTGHDLIVLRDLLKRCEKEGISVYTHGEMLPAHSYPELNKSKALVGHFGTAWQRQSLEFPHFPGAILATTNCITEPHEQYKPHMFTAGAVGWKGVKHIGDNLESINFDAVIEAAKAAPGFAASQTEFGYPDAIGTKRPAFHSVGFGHETVLSVAPTILDQVTKGNISRFVVMAGCDGYEGQRSIMSDVAKQLPPTAAILTFGCAKYRVLHLAEELGTIGDTGIPRVLDVGQCNDTFSAVQIALGLAGALKCEVSDLPISLYVSWLEQKAAAVLLSLLHLGLKNIWLGPSLPAFITKPVLQVLVNDFGVRPFTDAKSDVNSMVTSKGMIAQN